MKTLLALLAAFSLISPEFAALDRLAQEQYQAYEKAGLKALVAEEKLDAVLAYIEEQKAKSPADLWEPSDDLPGSQSGPEAPQLPDSYIPELPSGGSQSGSGMPVLPGSADRDPSDVPQTLTPQVQPDAPSMPEGFTPEPSPAPVETIRTIPYDKSLPWAQNAAI